MVLVLLSGTIAGCTGDPDGGGNDGIDSDALDDLFDQYFEDFVNNTTITVNNHYYNNTTYIVDDGDYSNTVVNEYNNTTINEGDQTSSNNYNNQTENDYSALNYTWGSSGNGSGSMVQVFRITWDPDEHVSPTDFGTRKIVINGTVQAPGWNGSELSYQYNGHLIKLSLTCEELINGVNSMGPDGWRDWIFDEYGGSYSQADNVGYSIHNDIYEIWNNDSGARGFCWRTTYSNPPLAYSYGDIYYSHHLEYFYHRVFEIPILAGQAVELLSIPYLRNVTLECDDGFSTTSSNGSFSDYAFAGGHTDCIISGHASISTAHSYVRTPISNGSGPSIQTPDWYNGGYWYAFTTIEDTPWDSYPYSSTPTDFLVYFTMYFVQVYEHDSE